MNPQTGELRPARCKSQRCPVCLWVEATRYGAAIALSKPSHHLVLTDLASDWPSAQRQLDRLRRMLTRSKALVPEWVVQLEGNPGRAGSHAHIWLHSGHLDRLQVSEFAQRAGMGREVKLRPTRAISAQALPYGLKAILDNYQGPEHISPASQAFLELNGGRLGHNTRGFWRGGPGQPLRGIRAAKQRASQTRTPGTWVFVPSANH